MAESQTKIIIGHILLWHITLEKKELFFPFWYEHDIAAKFIFFVPLLNC